MWRIPLCDLSYDDREQQAVADVLSSRWLTMGPRTEEFEARMASYLGTRHAIAVANCTCALELVYGYLLGRNSRRSVVVPDITFVATASAAIAQGGEAILADVASASSPLIGMDAVRAILDQREDQIAAIALVHYAGFSSFTDELAELASETGIEIVEDAAHAIGGIDAQGRALGTIGIAGCFSFFSNKNMATGEGGLIATNEEDLAQAVRLKRSHGMTSLTYERHRGHRYGYDVLSVGHNYRCTEITAALGIVQLDKLRAGNDRRRQLYRSYVEALNGLEQVEVTFGNDPEAIGQSSCHILPLLCQNHEIRDALRSHLSAAGIQTSHHYAPLSGFTAFKERGEHGPMSNANEFASREITLPLYPGMKDEHVEEICSIIRKHVH